MTPTEILTAARPILEVAINLLWRQPDAKTMARAFAQFGGDYFIPDYRIIQPALSRTAVIAGTDHDQVLSRVHCHNTLQLLTELRNYGAIFAGDDATTAWLSQLGGALPCWEVTPDSARPEEEAPKNIDPADREGVDLAMDDARACLMNAIGYVEALDRARQTYKGRFARTKVAKSIASGLLGMDSVRYSELTEPDYAIGKEISRAMLVAERAAIPFGFMRAEEAVVYLLANARKLIKQLLASFAGTRVNPANMDELETRVMELGDLAQTAAILRGIALLGPHVTEALATDLPADIMAARSWLADFDI